MKENTTQSQIEEDLTTLFLKNHPNTEEFEKRIFVQPFESLHLPEEMLEQGNGLQAIGDPTLPFMLSMIGFFILLMACINFTNMSIGTSLPRSAEVGVRKVLGAHKSHLFQQFMVETAFNAFISFIIAILLAAAALPVFNDLTGKTLVWQSALNWQVVLVGTGIFLLIILMAGSYPAWVIARFHVMKALKGKQKLAGKQTFGKALLVLQFAIAIFFMGTLGFVNQQIGFLTQQDLGYEPKGVMAITAYGQDVAKIAERMEMEFAGKNLVESISFNGGFGNGTYVKANEKDLDIHHECISPQFLEVMGIELKEGRMLTSDNLADHTKNVIVNEAFVKAAGWDVALGQHVTYNYYDNMEDVEVVGVVKDFNYHSLHQNVRPILMHINPEGVKGEILLKIKEGKETETLALAEKVWKEEVFFTPLNYYFEEDRVADIYEAEERLVSIISYTSIIAIIISLIGLFGIVGVALNQRTKEIGVRKVLGATYFNIYKILSKNFLITISIGFFVAIPAIWYVTEQWLQNFAYSIPIGVFPFILAGFAVLALAGVTVISRIYGTLRKNPVNALRDE